jgi:hypothetical protein
MKNFSGKRRENQTHIVLSVNFFSERRAVYEIIGKIWYSQTGHRRQYITAHALCVLDN